MASFIMKGLVTNNGIDRLKMVSTVYEMEISKSGFLVRENVSKANDINLFLIIFPRM